MKNLAVSEPRKRLFEQIDIAPDFYSATTKRTHIHYDEVKHQCIALLEQKAKEGGSISAYQRLGYDGFICENCFYGEKDNELFLSFSGRYGMLAFYTMHENGVNCSRIDLQTTIRVKRGVFNLALASKKAFQQLKIEKRINSNIKAHLWDSLGDGDSFYIGSTKSDMMIRIYDKGKETESERLNILWRIEVQLRHEYAQRAAQSLIYSDLDHDRYIAAIIQNYIEKYGIPIPAISDMPKGLPITVSRDKTTLARQLQWLSSSVRPVVRRLVASGKRDIVEFVLGLDDADSHTPDNEPEHIESMLDVP